MTNDQPGRKLSRRKLLKTMGVSVTGLGLTGISTATATAQDVDEETVEELLHELLNADDQEAFLAQLSEDKRQAVLNATSNVTVESTEPVVSQASVSSDAISPAAQTTYSKFHRVNVRSASQNWLILFYYDHTLDWTVENGDVISASVTTSGGTDLVLWGYYGDVDSYKYVDDAGCSSTETGIFKFCNNVQGVKVCEPDETTLVTSAISGFPSGQSSTSEIVENCYPNCPK